METKRTGGKGHPCRGQANSLHCFSAILKDKQAKGGGEKERGLACFCSFSLFFALQSSASLGEIGEDAGGGGGGGGLKSRGVLMAWSPSVGGGGGAVEPSDTESIESRESAKSRDTSPSHSPIVSMKTFQNYPASEVRRSHTYWYNNN